MAGADGIGPHVFHHLQLTFECPRIDRATETPQVMMQADAQYFGRFSVQGESRMLVPIEFAYAECGSIAIRQFIADSHLGYGGVQIRIPDAP